MTDTLQGTITDVEGGVDLTVGAHPVLYVWQDGAFVPSGTFTLTQDDTRRGHYAFTHLQPGFYTVRVRDNSGTYVDDTWPTGPMPSSPSDPAVREVRAVPDRRSTPTRRPRPRSRRSTSSCSASSATRAPPRTSSASAGWATG